MGMELGKAKRVTIYVGQPVGEHATPYVRILEKLKAEGAAGATAIKAIAAFGPREHVQTVRLADVAPDLPVIILWIDTPERVERILPHIREMVKEGLITVEDTTVEVYTSTVVPDLPKAVTVADVMTREVVTAHPDDPMSELVANLIGRRLHAIPVTSGEGKVEGIVTVGDLFLKGGLPISPEMLRTFDTPQFHDELLHLAQPRRNVAEVMTSPVRTVRPDLHVRDAAALMCRHKLVRVPVADASERLVGIISRADLVRAVAGGPTEKTLVFPRPAQVDGATPIGTIMTRDVPSVRSDASLRAVVDAVVSTRLNRAVVIDQEEHVLGVVADAELIDRLTPALHPGVLASLLHRIPLIHHTPEQEEAWRHATGNRANIFMITDIVIAQEQEPIRDVLASVYRKRRQVVPIVNDAKKLVGIVDRLDLLSVLVGRPVGDSSIAN